MTTQKHLHTVAFDRGSARTVDAQGFLHVEGCNISKAVVNPYWGSEIPDYEQLGLDPNKVYKLYRDPKELAKAADTFNNLPLMDDHIEVSALDLEDPEVKKKIVGSTGTSARFEAPYLINDLVVWTAGGIDGVQSKKQTELSCAYRYKLDMTPGTVDGESYDGRMYDLLGNHVALVAEGRAGKDVVVKDSKLRVNVDLKGVAKMVADALVDVKKKLGLATDGVPELVEQLTSLKAEIESKLKPGAEGGVAQALDDATSALDSAVHHLLDYQEDLDAKGGVVADDNPTGINQYTGAAGAARSASTAARSLGTAKAHLGAVKAHEKAADLASASGRTEQAGQHAAAAKSHYAEAKRLGYKSGGDGITADEASDVYLLLDVIKHRPGHRDSKGNPAPWVIVSESDGKVIWSGPTKEDAVAQLRNVEGHKVGGVTSDDNPTGINQYTGAAGAKTASSAANAASKSAQTAKEHHAASALHMKAVNEHAKAAKEAKTPGKKAEHERQAFNHNDKANQHTKAERFAKQHASGKAFIHGAGKINAAKDSVVADVAEREGVSPKAGVTSDDNPEGINQYTGAASKSAEASKTAFKTGKPEDHLAAANAHKESAKQAWRSNQRSKAMSHEHMAGHHEAEAEKASYNASRLRKQGQSHDASLATDKIVHMPGHRDSKGDPAPWVIVSEGTGDVIWSGPTREAAVEQLRNVEGHKAGSVTVDYNQEGINQYSGASQGASKASTKAKNLSEMANSVGTSSTHKAAQRAHEKASTLHRVVGNSQASEYHAAKAKEHSQKARSK